MIVHPMTHHKEGEARDSTSVNKSANISSGPLEEKKSVKNDNQRACNCSAEWTLVDKSGEASTIKTSNPPQAADRLARSKDGAIERLAGSSPTPNIVLAKTTEENSSIHNNSVPESPLSDGDSQGTAGNSRCAYDPSRRTIFKKFWHREEAVIGSHLELPPVDILEFSPPQQHRSLLSKRFSPVEGFLSNLSSPENMSLPAVPSPLLRYCGEQGGVYPLVKPASILRTSRFDSVNGRDESTTSCDQNGDRQVAEHPDSRCENAKHLESDSHSSSSVGDEKASTGFSMAQERAETEATFAFGLNKPLVRFDPRVTITEFEEPSGQKWFTEKELDSFKHEALVLAHRYMRLNPQVAKEFQVGHRDPVTGKVRQKAIFTNPALSANSDASLPNIQDSDTMKDLIASEIRKVLIVVFHEAIQKLFVMSIKIMFPQASILAVRSGEDAIKEIRPSLSRCDHFDVIIAEERLGRRQQGVSVLPVVTEKAAPGSEPGLSDEMPDVDTEHPMSGSNLLSIASQLLHKEDMHTEGSESVESHLSSSPDTKSSISLLSRVPLLIGVSMHLEEDSERMSASGADMTWDIPPPRAGRNLRNEIFRELLHKRHRLSAFAAFPADS